MRRLGKSLIVSAGILVAGAVSVPMFIPSAIWSAPTIPKGSPAPDAKRGAYMFNAGGCASCHTRKGGGALAGGDALTTPYGTFIAPNITPDLETGIGRWTERDFLRAMRVGVSPTGRHYYPSFPYSSYTNLTLSDLRDMWAYLRSVKPVSAVSKTHRLDFPWGFRPGIGLWKVIWFRTGPFKKHADRSAAWNRGAYLVLGATHCAECHTPRNFAGALEKSDWMAGTSQGPDGKPVPNITPHKDGIGNWSAQDMVFFLKSGMLPSGDATGGEMGKVIDHTSKLTDQDLAAIAGYLRSVPPRPERAKGKATAGSK